MDKLLELLKEFRQDVDFTTEEHLIDNNVLDSLEIMTLVVSLSDEFDIDITPLDIVPENFQSASCIYAMIQRLQDED